MKQPSIKHYLIIGFVLVVIFSSIPFRQVVEVTKTVEYTSNDEYYVEIGFGGPKVTWVKVMCNRTAEIRFMYQSGVWVSQENVLLATFRSTLARYDFNAEHTTNMIEVISEGPILVQIVYTYLTEMESSLFDRFLNTFRIY
jgi:hypothetical protein